MIRDTDGDDAADVMEDIVQGLPFGWHETNGLVVGTDGKLYVGLGSTCNACDEDDPRSASILRYNLDGSGEEIFATGLRNTYDMAFHPEDGTLWGADNGMQIPGQTNPPDELNLIVAGGDYGWPYCWGMGEGDDCSGKISPVTTLGENVSADGITFYTGDHFPDAFRNNIFIAEWGSFAGNTGRKVIRVVLEIQDGRYVATVYDFITGLDRPLDVVVDQAGALLVADYGTGIIYRVTHRNIELESTYLPLIHRD